MRPLSFFASALILALSAFERFTHISDLGLHYDEVLYVPAAINPTGSLTGFLYLRLLDFPVLLMPYIGALKAWIYTPIFDLFGVSVVSIRLPMLILYATVLLLILFFLVFRINATSGIAFSLIASTDAVIFPFVLTDFGPVVLGIFFAVAVFICLYVGIKKESRKHLYSTAILGALGVFNKLDFAFVLGAILLSFAIVFWREIRNWMICNPWTFVTFALLNLPTFVLGLTSYLRVKDSLPSSRSQEGFLEGVSSRSKLILDTLSGESAFSLFAGETHGALTWQVVIKTIVVVLGLIALGSCAPVRHPPSEVPSEIGANVLKLLVSTGLWLVLVLLLVPEVGGPHHVIPLAVVLMLASSVALGQLATDNARKRSFVFFYAMGTLLTLSSIVISTGVRSSLDQAVIRNVEQNFLWNKEPTELARVLGSFGPPIVVGDWGISTQLEALTHPYSSSLVDLWPSFADHQEAEIDNLMPTILHYSDEGSFVLVGRPPGLARFSGADIKHMKVLDYCRQFDDHHITRIYEGKFLVADSVKGCR